MSLKRLNNNIINHIKHYKDFQYQNINAIYIYIFMKIYVEC